MLFAIAAIVTALTIALLAVRPYYGVLLALAAKPMIDATWDQSFAGVNLLQIISVAMPTLLLPRLIGHPYWRVPSHRPWLQLGLIYIAVQLLSSALFFAFAEPIVAIEATFRSFNGLLGFIMLPVFATNDKRLKQILLALIIAGLFPILVSIYQELTGTVWSERMTVGFVRRIGLYHDAVSIRHFGLQSLLAMLMYIELFRPKGLFMRLFLGAYLVGALIMLYFGYTRGGMVTLGVWFIIWCTLRRKIQWVIGMVAAVLSIQVFNQINFASDIQQLFQKEIGYYEGTLADDRMLFNGRFFIWENWIDRWEEQDFIAMVFGGETTGAGTHNEILRVLVANGVVGLFFYLIVIGLIIFFTLKRFFFVGRRSLMTVYAVMLLAMYSIEALGATPGLYPQYQWYVFGLMGICLFNERYYQFTRSTSFFKRSGRHGVLSVLPPSGHGPVVERPGAGSTPPLAKNATPPPT